VPGDPTEDGSSFHDPSIAPIERVNPAAALREISTIAKSGIGTDYLTSRSLHASVVIADP
jgi:hypothetical protein